MKIFITAITSYLGSNFARVLAARGHEVSGSDRSRIQLGRPFDSALLSGQDVVVHCAHDFSSTAANLNIEGTKAICDAARGQGVGRQVFVSSLSAVPDAPSEYGRIKFELESHFLRQREICVRPGLVIGNGGLFGRNMRTILKTPLLPLADGGRDPIAFIGIEDLAQAMAAVIESAAPDVYNLFHSDVVTLRILTESLNRRARHRALYVSVPVSGALFLLSAAKAIGIRLPVEAGSLKALRKNRDCPHRSDLRKFVSQPCSLDAALDAALRSFRESPLG